MSRFARLSLPLQALFYVAAGVNHFWHRGFYVAIMPEHYTDPALWVKLSGVAEILGGVGLAVPRTRRAASFGLASMLVAFLDVHVYMLQHPERFPTVPRWVLWARLPIQGVLIAWALQCGRLNRATRP